MPMDRFRVATRRALPWLLAFSALLTLPAASSAQALRVAQIEIRGNQRINEASIRAVLATKVGDEVSLERLERDRRAIEALGWFQAVSPPTVQNVPNGVRVIFVVREFPVISSLTFTGSSLYSDEQLAEISGVRVGEVFNAVTWSEALTKVNDLYSDKGYLVRVSDNRSAPEFLRDGVLRMIITELKVGQVIIQWPSREIKDKDGNVIRTVSRHKTRNYVVLRELSQREGVLFNQNQISKDFRALQGLGHFQTIDPKVDITTEQTVVITWVLTEKRTGQISVGAGFSARQNLLGRAELSDSNFHGKGIGLRLSVEQGAFGTDGSPSFDFTFFQPWLLANHTSMTVSVFDRLVFRFSTNLGGRRGVRFDDDRFFERHLGARITFGHPFGWPASLHVRGERVNTGNLPVGVGVPPQDGSVFAFGGRVEKNTRDYPNYPTSGGVKAFNNEIGFATLDTNSKTSSFSSSLFDKGSIDYRRYFRLKSIKARKEPKRQQESETVQVIAIRVLAGATAGDVPFFEQFFVGGSQTLRGYREDRFWGKNMFLASVEYRRPLLKKIVGVIFADAGHAWGSPKEFRFTGKAFRTDFTQSDSFQPRASIGVGVRVATPVGPIRLDFGLGSEGTRTHFSFGHAF